MNNTDYTNDFIETVKDYILTKLDEFNYEGFTIYGCDLHNEIFNTDYVTIGTYQAKEELGEIVHDVFTALETYQEEFGEGYRDIGDPERVLNLVYYMAGSEVMNNIEFLNSDDKWNSIIDYNDIKIIMEELNK